MSSSTQSIPILQIIPDSPSGTLPSTHSESDWQSLHTITQITPPSLILDASSPIISQCRPADLPLLLERLRTLPLAISGLDGTPDPISSPLKRSNGVETKLGSAPDATGIAFGTKVSTRGSHLGYGKGELHAENVRQSLLGTLSRTRRRKASWLIAQRPDGDVALGEVTGGFEGLVNEGLCENWGVRNFRTRNLRDLLITCRRRSYTGPRIYQGEYNILWRRIMEARMPLIREHGMIVHAYEPLSKGALATSASTLRPSSQSSTAWRTTQYDTFEMQQAIQLISTAAAMHEMSLQSAALRWLAYHSKLGQEDSIILGGSTFEDVEEKTAVIAKGPLPEEMVSLLQNVGENLWDGSIVL